MALPRTRCACGKVMSKDSIRCKACDQVLAIKREEEAQGHVKNGCPLCKLPLRRNNALTGWWQCSAFGEVSFRDEQYRSAPKCGFQTFTRN